MNQFWRDFAEIREKALCRKLQNDPEYTAILERQDKLEDEVNKVFETMDFGARGLIERFYGGERELLEFELHKSYLELARCGMRLLEAFGLSDEAL